MAVDYIKNFFKLLINSFSTEKSNISGIFIKNVEKTRLNINMLKKS